jgi:hypothetical protein
MNVLVPEALARGGGIILIPATEREAQDEGVYQLVRAAKSTHRTGHASVAPPCDPTS